MKDKGMNKKLKIVLIVMATVILIGGIAVALLFMFKNNTIDDGEQPDVTGPAEIISGNLVAVRVTDYSFGSATRITEGTYKSEDGKMNIYENGTLIGYDATAIFDGTVMELNLSESADISLDEYSAGYSFVYKIGIEETQKFISKKIENGEELVRMVQAPNYCEVYLNSNGTLTRYIIESNRLTFNEFSGTSLPSVTTYFNYVASTIEQ